MGAGERGACDRGQAGERPGWGRVSGGPGTGDRQVRGRGGGG